MGVMQELLKPGKTSQDYPELYVIVSGVSCPNGPVQNRITKQSEPLLRKCEKPFQGYNPTRRIFKIHTASEGYEKNFVMNMLIIAKNAF